MPHKLDKMIRPVSARSAVGVIGEVLVPFAARGPIVRRPRVTGWLERVDADRRAVARLEERRGRNLVLLVTSTLLAKLLRRAEFRQVPPGGLSGSQPLPATLNPFGLRFESG